MQEPRWDKLPVLLEPAQVRAILGKMPRDLENMVMVQAPGKKTERKLFSKKEVRARWMAR